MVFTLKISLEMEDQNSDNSPSFPKIEVEDNLEEILKKEKQGWLDKLLKMYPALENDKKNIEKCLTKKSYKSEEELKAKYTNDKEIVLERVKIGDTYYYKDQRNVLWNSEATVCGIIDRTKEEPKYIIFDDHDVEEEEFLP